MSYVNSCVYCEGKFEVKYASENDPTNKKRFKRCCSKECLSKLRSNLIKGYKDSGAFDEYQERRKTESIILTKIPKEKIVKLLCYEHKNMVDIAKELNIKESTLRREIKRLNIKREFIKNCPQCGEEHSVPHRSMVNPESNKFKKYCSRSCFLSSRNQTDTWIEREIETFLIEKGVEFQKQVPIKRMTVDFIVSGTNLIIEANGDFWHANPNIYGKTKPFHKSHKKIIKKDARKMSQLLDKGFKVLVVWENDLALKKEETLDRMYENILNELREQKDDAI